MSFFVQYERFQETAAFRPAFIKVFFAFLRVFAPLRYVFDIHAIALQRADSVLVGHAENGVRQPVAEGIVVLELLEQLGVVGE